MLFSDWLKDMIDVNLTKNADHLMIACGADLSQRFLTMNVFYTFDYDYTRGSVPYQPESSRLGRLYAVIGSGSSTD